MPPDANPHAALCNALEASFESLRAGDPAARERVVELVATRMRQMAHRMLQSFRFVRRWDDTDDVVQNASLRFLRALDETVPESPRHLVNLAALQIRRELVDLVRKHRGPESYAMNHDSNSATIDGKVVMRVNLAEDPHAADPGIDRWTLFHDSAERLPADEREIFELAWYVGADQAQVAALLGCSVRTVKRRWEAAKGRIRQACDDAPPRSNDPRTAIMASDPDQPPQGTPEPPADGPAPGAPVADTDPALAFDLETIWNAVERVAPEFSDPLLGRNLGGVTLVRLIGEGGMGRIYEGRQDSPKRAVAVKVQRPGRLDREHTQRFVRELAILGRISHPWVCRIYSAGIHEQTGAQFPYFVMEYIPGAMPITDYAASGNLPLENRVRLLRHVCEAVAAGHARGIHHRDLKPGNVLVDADGFPKVIDFGVAHACGSDAFTSSLTQSGQLVGTLQYSAPELLGGDDADARSDVWSLGMMLHELVTGRLPFDVTGLPILAAIARISRHEPGLRRTALGRTSRAIAEVVDACMEASPANRPADAAEVAKRLSHLLATAQSAPLVWSRSAIEERPAGARGSRLRAWSLAAGATALLGALVILLPGPLAPRGQTDEEGDANATTGVVASPISRPDFQFGFPTIDSEGAEKYVVETTGLSTWHEPFGTNKSYWAPREHDVEGRLVYRFDFPRPSRRIHLLAHIATWDDTKQKGVLGRGAGAIEASTDGENWIEIVNGIDPPAWGTVIDINGFLPEACTGSSTLWIRVRMLTTGAWAAGSYNVAQFGGADVDNTTNVFQIDVECVPPEAPQTATAGAP